MSERFNVVSKGSLEGIHSFPAPKEGTVCTVVEVIDTPLKGVQYKLAGWSGLWHSTHFKRISDEAILSWDGSNITLISDGSTPVDVEKQGKQIYLCGSLRNPDITPLANRIQEDIGVSVFADWYGAGPNADDHWRDYEKQRGFSYKEALGRPAAKNVYEFDKKHIDASDVMVLALPAGKSGHLELGYHLGKGKPGFILLDDPDRWDVMYQFATGVASSYEELAEMLGDWYGK